MPETLTRAPIYGNYHGYYTKRPLAKDPRLSLLPVETFRDARVLDIGCNEGYITCEIAQSWGASKVVGVDIDDTLIQAAWRRRRTVWSLQEPSEHNIEVLRSEEDAISRKRKREAEIIPSEKSKVARADYFPISCEHEFGSLPVPPSQNRGKHVFPHNVSFRTADWTNTEIPEDTERYNVVVAFSISKWIHLNAGDEGLKNFFRKIYQVLEPGGTFILEPQTWDSYGKAKRMNERLKENAKNLKLRPDDFEAILTSLGFGPARHLGTAGEGGFRRSIEMYIKPSS